MFGHEKLEVYRRAKTFLDYRANLLIGIDHRVAACDHLDRAGESIPLNISHASGAMSPKVRLTSLGHAYGSALECAACLDILKVRERIGEADCVRGKGLLREIVNMLMAMRRQTADRVCEAEATYATSAPAACFDHEKLRAYQSALAFVACLQNGCGVLSCSADLLAKLDQASTSVILNLVEGNGRFTNPDKVKFWRTAYKANLHISALLDIATQADSAEARALLATTGKCLTGLIKSKSITSTAGYDQRLRVSGLE